MSNEDLKDAYDGFAPGAVVEIPDEGPSADEIRAYCVEQGARIARDRQGLDLAYETYKETDPAKAHEFERIDWLRQGEQTALRNLLEYFGINHK
ncbi:gp96 [Mycobacterium phage Barnyard]|uniref:Uncharacterized protein n=1 Tax=Mycobacterium phage Barnyard TaxID=205880 RepID=Q855X6_9CAUD|nr:gp96 [Mycobacterium phage Barnyard]AAN02150.1 hypothetical protein PBI_BARNYARD_96 [Mycobacterium phage Barnyard]